MEKKFRKEKTWIVIKAFNVPVAFTNHTNRYQVGYEICEEEMFFGDFKELLADRFDEFIKEKTN